MTKTTQRVTETGGRAATTRHIPPKLALAVGMPSSPAPSGWQWSPLANLARLESGHTPSRRHPEYWGGKIPWISLQDAKANNGEQIDDTGEKTNNLGIENSSARVLPKDTVCLSRTASVGYVVVMGRSMATSQDFVNWVCSERLDPNFLKYLLIAEGENLLRFASGAVHNTIYFPEVKAFHICHPSLTEQQRIVRILDEALDGIATAKANAEKNLENARAVFESHLESIFERCRESWTEKRLEELVTEDCTLSYGIVQPGHDQPGGLPVVRPTDLTTKFIELDGLKRIEPKLANAYARTTLRGGELLLCVRGSTGMVSIALPELAGANVTRGIVPIRFDARYINQQFGYYALMSSQVQGQIREKTYGAALMQINIRDLRNVTISYPSIKEQSSIVRNLNALAEETDRLEAILRGKAYLLADLRQSFLHDAFVGSL
jgi:type I restriction enzyme S subunit